MFERTIACILNTKYVDKVGKYVVRLGFSGERAREEWVSEKQLAALEANFRCTPNAHSTDRAQVIGVWDDRGYYFYSKFKRQDFIEPEQYSLKDLQDD